MRRRPEARGYRSCRNAPIRGRPSWRSSEGHGGPPPVTGGVGGASSRAPRSRRGGRRPASRRPSVVRRRFIEKGGAPCGSVLRRFKVREHERGLLFKDREFKGVLRPGRHFIWDLLRKVRVDVVSVRDVWLSHKDLDVIAKSGALGRRGAGPGPEGPRARRGVGRRPRRRRPEAGPVRAVDRLPRRAGRGLRRPRRALRARAISPSSPRLRGAAAAARGGDGRGRPRRPVLQGRPARGHAGPRRPRLLEGRRQGPHPRRGPARAGRGRRRPGDHDRRQGDAAPERGRDLQGGRSR